MLIRQNVKLKKCKFDKMSIRQSGKLMKLPRTNIKKNCFYFSVPGYVEQRKQRPRAVRARPDGTVASQNRTVADRVVAGAESSVRTEEVAGGFAPSTLRRRHSVRGDAQGGDENVSRRFAAENSTKRRPAEQPQSGDAEAENRRNEQTRHLVSIL